MAARGNNASQSHAMLSQPSILTSRVTRNPEEPIKNLSSESAGTSNLVPYTSVKHPSTDRESGTLLAQLATDNIKPLGSAGSIGISN